MKKSSAHFAQICPPGMPVSKKPGKKYGPKRLAALDRPALRRMNTKTI